MSSNVFQKVGTICFQCSSSHLQTEVCTNQVVVGVETQRSGRSGLRLRKRLTFGTEYYGKSIHVRDSDEWFHRTADRQQQRETSILFASRLHR